LSIRSSNIPGAFKELMRASLLRDRMAGRLKVPVSFPPLHLCTDNAAMIGAAAHYAYIRGVRDALDMDVNPDLNF
jgi:N6-L-threonylcarbamoyladenine synthase